MPLLSFTPSSLPLSPFRHCCRHFVFAAYYFVADYFHFRRFSLHFRFRFSFHTLLFRYCRLIFATLMMMLCSAAVRWCHFSDVAWFFSIIMMLILRRRYAWYIIFATRAAPRWWYIIFFSFFALIVGFRFHWFSPLFFAITLLSLLPCCLRYFFFFFSRHYVIFDAARIFSCLYVYFATTRHAWFSFRCRCLLPLCRYYFAIMLPFATLPAMPFRLTLHADVAAFPICFSLFARLLPMLVAIAADFRRCYAVFAFFFFFFFTIYFHYAFHYANTLLMPFSHYFSPLFLFFAADAISLRWCFFFRSQRHENRYRRPSSILTTFWYFTLVTLIICLCLLPRYFICRCFIRPFTLFR